MEQVRAPEITHIPSNLQYYGCGALQMLFFIGYGAFGLWLLVEGFQWTYPAVSDTSANVARSPPVRGSMASIGAS